MGARRLITKEAGQSQRSRSGQSREAKGAAVRGHEQTQQEAAPDSGKAADGRETITTPRLTAWRVCTWLTEVAEEGRWMGKR